MTDIHELQRLCELACRHSKADQTTVYVSDGELGLTRFTNNSIHQNTIIHTFNVTVQVLVNDRPATISTELRDEQSIKNTVDSAIEMTHCLEKLPHVLPLYGAVVYPHVSFWDESIAQTTPEQRSELVQKIVQRAIAHDAIAAGSIGHRRAHFCVMNSAGFKGSYSDTDFMCNITMDWQEQTGWARQIGWQKADVNENSIIDQALSKALCQKAPVVIQPGQYEVILEPEAIANLLESTSWGAFNARMYKEGTSFLSGQLGNRIASPLITIKDDPSNPLKTQVPFDMEGVPRKSVIMIDKGIFTNLLHDRYTAEEFNTESTGHGRGDYSQYGPFPSQMIIEGGDASFEDMIAQTERALIITRFHYNRMVDYKHARLTGVTRDGVFLVEHGKIEGRVNNLRYNQSVLEALQNVIQVGSNVRVAGEHGFCITPALRIKNFTFTEIV